MAVRTASTLAAVGNVAGMFTPPVKSMARFRPRVANDPMETMTMRMDSPYHTLRVAMNGKLVGL
jgi:hypothetical protein